MRTLDQIYWDAECYEDDFGGCNCMNLQQALEAHPKLKAIHEGATMTDRAAAPEIPSDQHGCCACLTVRYDPIEIAPGTFTERWHCQECGMVFTKHVHLAKAEQELAEAKGWRRKYFDIERAHSQAVDKISALITRIQLRERELAERGSQKSALEQELAALEAELARLKALAEAVMIGGNHLASSLIGTQIPNDFADYSAALRAHGQPYADMWIAWKRIMEFRDAINPPKEKTDAE